MGKKIRITESQLKKIVGGLVTEQEVTNSNISPLRGKTVNLYKDMNAATTENFAFQVKIRNVFQEKGIIKILVYTKINEPDMYLQHDCGKDGFNLHKSSFFPSNRTVFNAKLQEEIRKTVCATSDSGKQEVPNADFKESEGSPQSLAENTLKNVFKRLIK
jgi:hypothetical protein